jgi:hypothetical protein
MSNFFRKEQLTELFLAHFREIIREPGVIFWGIVFPILMALGLGVAFTKKADVTHHVAIIGTGNQANPERDGRSKLQDFLNTYCTLIETGEDETPLYQLVINDKKLGNTKFLFQKTTWKEATVLLKRGNLSILLDDKNGQLTYHFDPLNPDAQLTFLKLSRIINSDKKNIKTIKANI